MDNNDRHYVYLRPPGRPQVVAMVEAEADDLLRLSPGSRGEPLPVGPEPVHVGWMTPSGIVWCGGLVVRHHFEDGAVRVRLLGPPVPVERRQHVRLPVNLEVEIRRRPSDPETTRGRCVDLSPGGMQVVLPLELPVGNVVAISLRSDDGDRTEVTARIARRIGPTRFGFAFELVIVGSLESFTRFALDQATRIVARPEP